MTFGGFRSLLICINMIHTGTISVGIVLLFVSFNQCCISFFPVAKFDVGCKVNNLRINLCLLLSYAISYIPI